MGRMHLCRSAGYQGLPRASIPGLSGQAIGVDPAGMGLHIPCFPCQFHQMTAPVAPCVFPSVLIPRNPVPGESTAYRTAPSRFLNPHPGITQHGVWEPSMNEMLLRPSLGYSMTSTGVRPRLGAQATPFSDGVYRFPACLSNLSTMPLSETNYVPHCDEEFLNVL
ncbi:hypothetical protein Salat_1936400 [Sesamum alatum]|uniref:Uncharacterized protein n=1 Tax=Sesamum alatum TaxID=300844 RepID=A0AAE1Y4D2_9LAMI|nr:hypothetical protein Salat_1936400 [Sesamum alatum]